MAWNPNGILIVQGCKTFTQRHYTASTKKWSTRKTTFERLLWRGLDAASARQKQTELAADDDNYTEADATRVDDSGQWQVSAIKRTVGTWEEEA